jgi:hypothetical protein
MKILRRLGAVAAVLLLVVGCSQDNTLAPTSPPAPTAVAPQGAASGDLLGGVVGTVTSTLKLTTANGLQRKVALANDINVSANIGRAGGVLSIPEAGVTVLVPPGALDATTTITMTARKGTLVAYDFAPHGITFKVPLVFSQRLGVTKATLLEAPFLRLGYYSDPSLLGQTTALVSELLGGVVSVLNWSFTAPIKHFSGYVVSCGRGALSD